MKFGKSIETLLEAPYKELEAMREFMEYRQFATELHNDINQTYDHPALWAAIERLIEFVETYAKEEVIMGLAGFTIDDAFALAAYDRELQDKEDVCQ